jgi:hypothetical protein
VAGFFNNILMLKLVECPRDAMQGITEFIDTQKKVEYINTLIQAGFHTIDAGSFVSAILKIPIQNYWQLLQIYVVRKMLWPLMK